MPASVDSKLCDGCGECIEICPNEAISLDEVAYVNEDECAECGLCVDECPNGAITLDEE